MKDDPPSASSASAAEYLFLAPIRNLTFKGDFVGKPGPEIMEAVGNPVWEEPLGRVFHVGAKYHEEVAMDFHTATYAGQPVLVWWQGYITPNGFGTGTWKIVNDHYQTIASLRAPSGYETDFHAFQINSNGMAYFLANKIVALNLQCCGGPADGRLYDQVVFEANIKTGKIVWSWDPLQHIPLRDTYATVPRSEPWDRVPHQFDLARHKRRSRGIGAEHVGCLLDPARGASTSAKSSRRSVARTPRSNSARKSASPGSTT